MHWKNKNGIFCPKQSEASFPYPLSEQELGNTCLHTNPGICLYFCTCINIEELYRQTLFIVLHRTCWVFNTLKVRPSASKITIPFRWYLLEPIPQLSPRYAYTLQHHKTTPEFTGKTAHWSIIVLIWPPKYVQTIEFTIMHHTVQTLITQHSKK